MEPNQHGKYQKIPGRYQRQVQHYYSNQRRHPGLGSQQIRASQQLRASHQVRASFIAPFPGAYAGGPIRSPFQRFYFGPANYPRLCHPPVLLEAPRQHQVLNATAVPENISFGPQPPTVSTDAIGYQILRPVFGQRPAIALREQTLRTPSAENRRVCLPQTLGPQPAISSEVRRGCQYPSMLCSQPIALPSLRPLSQPMMNPPNPQFQPPFNPDIQCGSTSDGLQMLCTPPGGTQHPGSQAIQGSQHSQTQISQPHPHPAGFAGFPMGNQPRADSETSHQSSEGPPAPSSDITGASGHQWVSPDPGAIQYHLLPNWVNTIPTNESCNEGGNLGTDHSAGATHHDVVNADQGTQTLSRGCIPYKELPHCAVATLKPHMPCTVNPIPCKELEHKMGHSNPDLPCEKTKENAPSPSPSTSTDESDDTESSSSEAASEEGNDRTAGPDTATVEVEETPESVVKSDFVSDTASENQTVSSGETTAAETESPNTISTCKEVEDYVGSSNPSEDTETFCGSEAPTLDSPLSPDSDIVGETKPSAPAQIPMSPGLGFSMVGVYRSGALSHPGILTEEEEAEIRIKKQNMDSLIEDMQKVLRDRMYLLNPLHMNDIERLSQDYIMYCHNELKKLAAKQSANAIGNREYVRRLKHELHVLMADKEKILDVCSVDCELLDEFNRKEQSLHDELTEQNNLSYNLHIAAAKIQKEIAEIEERKLQLSLVIHDTLTLKEMWLRLITPDMETNGDIQQASAAQANPDVDVPSQD